MKNISARKCSTEKPAIKRKRGGQTLYTTALAELICSRLAKGETLSAICKGEGMPAAGTVCDWVAQDVGPGFGEMYARARTAGLDVMADALIEIADDGSHDKRVDAKGNEIVDLEHINRSRLRVDARKWYLSKMAPKRYGDRVQAEVTGPNGGPVQVVVNINPVQ